MTVRKLTRLICDDCGQGSKGNASEGDADQVRALRCELMGWTALPGGRDLCRRCSDVAGQIVAGKLHKKFLQSRAWDAARQAIFERDGRVCYLCSGEATQIDHVLPKSRFPHLALDLANLKPVCWPCNKRKGISH